MRDEDRIDEAEAAEKHELMDYVQHEKTWATFTNIVKHAGARTITVKTGCTQEQIFIEVADDGCGFVRNNEGGRGLCNMRKRAQALGAKLELLPSSSGTTVSLYLSRA